VEAEVQAPLGKAGEEFHQGLGVPGPGGAEAQRASVAENHVDEPVGTGGEGGPGAFRAPGPRGVRQPLGRGGHTPLSVRGPRGEERPAAATSIHRRCVPRPMKLLTSCPEHRVGKACPHRHCHRNRYGFLRTRREGPLGGPSPGLGASAPMVSWWAAGRSRGHATSGSTCTRRQT
jgi:hypothetical protein